MISAKLFGRLAVLSGIGRETCQNFIVSTSLATGATASAAVLSSRLRITQCTNEHTDRPMAPTG